MKKRGTASNRARGAGGGGGGGVDDKRPYSKPLPEDAYEQWTEDDLSRMFERILELAGSRFLGNMPLCNKDASTLTPTRISG